MSRAQWIVVAQREFLERVRTRWFMIVTLLGPVAMVGLIVVPAWLSARSAEEARLVQVVDRTGRDLATPLESALEAVGSKTRVEAVPPGTGEAELLGRIRAQQIEGFLVLPEDLMSGGAAIYRGANASNMGFKGELQGTLQIALVQAKVVEAGVSPEAAAGLFAPITLVTQQTTGDAATASGEASFVVGYAVMFILYMSILLYAVNVMRSVVQEKTSRVVELIVSAVRPRSLMLGKVIGVGGVGLLQLSIWAGMALGLLAFRGELLGLFGIESKGDLSLPPLDALDVVLILGYFALGYFFYGALYAAVGAMVNSDQEAQQAQTPIVLLLILPVVMVQLVVNNPRSGVSQALTQIPFSSPVLMPMRYLLGGATPAEIAVSLAILVASTLGAVALAGRIYRVGILMYGKRPTLRELARWVRHS